MIDYEQIERNCLDQMTGDFMPLHDLVREFSGYHEFPTEEQFMASMKFLEYLSKKHKIRFIQGPEMNELKASFNEMMELLKNSWYSNEYDLINYKIWLKMSDY